MLHGSLVFLSRRAAIEAVVIPDTGGRSEFRADTGPAHPLSLIVVLVVLIGLAAGSEASASVRYITQWGTHGPENGQFAGPTDLAADRSGTVFVSDIFGVTPRIQKFDSSGGFLLEWGSSGVGSGQFLSPGGIATGPSGDVYVGDYLENRIQRFGPDGSFLNAWGASGSGDGQFAAPQGIATDPSGNVFVVDYGNARVQRFTSAGTFITEWGSFGSGNGQFLSPSFIAADASGHVFVADSGNSRIQKFTAGGKFLDKWASPGPGVGVPDYPQGIATDTSGDVFVVGTNSIQKYSPRGALLTRWGTYGKGNGQFSSPQGIATDSSGNIYVGDSGNDRIQKFHDSGPPYPDPGAARLKIMRASPGRFDGGRSGRLRVAVRNTGSSQAKKVKLCVPGSRESRRAFGRIGCTGVGNIGAGGRRTARIKVRARCGAAFNVELRFKAAAANTGPATSAATVSVTSCDADGRGQVPERGLG